MNSHEIAATIVMDVLGGNLERARHLIGAFDNDELEQVGAGLVTALGLFLGEVDDRTSGVVVEAPAPGPVPAPLPAPPPPPPPMPAAQLPPATDNTANVQQPVAAEVYVPPNADDEMLKQLAEANALAHYANALRAEAQEQEDEANPTLFGRLKGLESGRN